MADMLIDGAKLDACNTAEADAIRAKTGGTDPIPYDYANNKGFADAIAAIPSGSGSSDNVVIALPDGYKVVNCISIPLGGYVNTLVASTSDWNDYYLDARLDTPISDIVNPAMLIGSRSGSRSFSYIGIYSTYNGFVFQLASDRFFEAGNKDNQRHIFQAKDGQSRISVDSVVASGGGSSLSLNSPMLIGARQTSDGTGIERECALTVWRYTHTKGTSKAIDLIPCKRKSDGEYGFFDLVSESFFGNLGTGTFTEGVE